MANETKTEDLVIDHFKSDPLFSDKAIKVIVERQQSANPKVDELLQGQSKGKGKGSGRPDFILTFPTNSNYIIAIECKAEASKHKSKDLTKPENIRDYAVDGALHYAKALSKGFDVLAIAVSGENKEDFTVSHILWKHNATNYETTNDTKLLSLNNYLKLFRNEHFADSLLNTNIIEKAIYLNELFHSYSIQEIERCTMISAVLLALTHEPFRQSYQSQTTIQGLASSMQASIQQVLLANSIHNLPAMLTEYSKLNGTVLLSNNTISRTKPRETKQTLDVFKTEIINYLHENVYPLLDKDDAGFDVLGKFYTEFIRYAGTQQSLGLVLTPQHITDLFCDLAELTKNDILYDPCCGTGGFLIAGMKRMFQLVGNDNDKKQNIRTKQLVGVEYLPQMYTYTCSNMMLRGDGKTNVHQGDCFQFAPLIKENHKPTVSFLNPPYNVGSDGQMRFIEHSLDMVAPQNGRVVAIVQMSCAIKNERELIAVKERILAKHHLKAVLSMPDDLFYPVGVVTCIMIFEAGKPNAGKETWFGYFKDDKFEKRKNQGRIDVKGLYGKEKERWINAYLNQKEIAGLSVKQQVTADDEWCAEAYMETDYSTLINNDFIKKMREYVAFQILINKDLERIFVFKPFSETLELNTDNWKWFELEKLFDYKRGTRLTKENREIGNIPLVTAGLEKEGVAENISNEEMTRYQKAVTIDMFGNSFYREYEFCCDDNILVLTPKETTFSNYTGIFIASILNIDTYKCAYGRQYRQKTFKQHKIKLPITSNGKPDWQFMEDYIKGLPYSKCL